MLTIGQTPREDILPPFIEILGEGYEIIEAGALDDFTYGDIKKIVFRPDDYILISRLRNGKEVKITKRLILASLQKKIHELEDEGVKIIVIMCTGNFPKFESKRLIIIPQEILKGVLKATLKQGKLGVVYPAKEQISNAESTFGRNGIQIYADQLSPYQEAEDILTLANRLTENNLDLILLNCFGYNPKVKQIVVEKTQKPVILSNALVARVLKELI